MPDTVRLDELVSVANDKVVLNKDPSKPYLGLEHLPTRGAYISGFAPSTDSISTNSVFRKGDVLFGKLRPNLRKAVLAPFDGYCSTDLLVLRARDDTYPGFAGRVFQSEIVGAAAERTAIGTKMPRTSWRQLKKQLVFVPPFEEQQKIAQILDTLDTQIRQTEALIAKLEGIKQGLLTHLLTRGIDQNGQLRLMPDQAPHLYKDSPLGRIPRECGIACVGDVGEVITGSTPPSSDPAAWGDSLPFFTPADVVGYEPMQTAERAISERGQRYIRKIPAGSTLVVCIGSTIGKVGFTASSGATNQQINAVVPSSPWDDYFVFQAVLTYVGQIRAWAGLQAVPIVNKSTFSTMLIPQPRFEEQEAISEKIRAFDERISTEKAVIEKLSQEKSGLMDDLLTGRVRVTPLMKTKEQATA